MKFLFDMVIQFDEHLFLRQDKFVFKMVLVSTIHEIFVLFEFSRPTVLE